MPAPRGNKRARADTVAEEPAQHSTENLASILAAMTPAMRTKLLTEAATNHPDVMASITAWYDKKMAAEATKIIEFEPLAEKAYDIIRKATQKDVDSSKVYDVAFRVLGKIEDILKTIAKSVSMESQFETKYNAIEAIRDIYESCVGRFTGNAVSKVMRQNFYQWAKMGLQPVLETFSEEELKELVDIEVFVRTTEPATEPATEWDLGTTINWVEKFEETHKECKSYCVEGPLGTEEALEVLRAAKDLAG